MLTVCTQELLQRPKNEVDRGHWEAKKPRKTVLILRVSVNLGDRKHPAAVVKETKEKSEVHKAWNLREDLA